MCPIQRTGGKENKRQRDGDETEDKMCLWLEGYAEVEGDYLLE